MTKIAYAVVEGRENQRWLRITPSVSESILTAGFAPGDQVEIRLRSKCGEEYDRWHALTGVLFCPTCHWRLLTPGRWLPRLRRHPRFSWKADPAGRPGIWPRSAHPFPRKAIRDPPTGSAGV